MNKEKRKFRKTTKVRARRRDFVKKRNIIKFFTKERAKELVEYKLPVAFPKRRKKKKATIK